MTAQFHHVRGFGSGVQLSHAQQPLSLSAPMPCKPETKRADREIRPRCALVNRCYFVEDAIAFGAVNGRRDCCGNIHVNNK